MKSKSYILSQIKDLLIERHGYTETKAERYIEVHASDKVYELLVLKKSLSEQEQYPEISFRKTIWRHHYDSDE
jgi:hypothetical protein|tara:strand:+ start:2647 stop:2865 length:219 start_codon:yes stop_codon:yes gene_type:complete